ncbi:MAG: hypothetical protein ACM3Q1_00760 [Bacteroidales bacterium]
MNNIHTRHCCAVPGCVSPTRSPRAHYCEAHRQRWKRHGHAQQQAVTKAMIRPYVARVRAIMAKGEAGRLDAALRQLHAVLADHAAQVSADHLNGKPSQKWGRIAAQELGKVVETTDPMSCAAVVVAVYLLQQERPQLFVDDTSFRFQLVRMFRAQAETAFGRYWDHGTGTSKTVYRDLSRKATQAMGRMIAETYARLVAHVIALDQADRIRQAAIASTLDAAFAA